MVVLAMSAPGGPKSRKRHKGRYGMAKKTEVHGITFASKHEADRYLELDMLRNACKIRDLVLQPVYLIRIGGVDVRFVGSNRQLKYIADFKYYDMEQRREVIEDAKGHLTEVYKIKRALMRAMGYTIDEV